MKFWQIALYVSLSIGLGIVLHEVGRLENEPSLYERLKKWAHPHKLHLAYIWARYSDECERDYAARAQRLADRYKNGDITIG